MSSSIVLFSLLFLIGVNFAIAAKTSKHARISSSFTSINGSKASDHENNRPSLPFVNNRTILGNFQWVVTDIETTGLSSKDQILEIAACSDDSEFDIYMMPTIPISQGAADVTGFHVEQGELYHKNEKLETKPAKTAVLDFIKYLKNFGRPVILLAHTGFRFDAPRILKLIRAHGLLQEFMEVVAGFADSLEIFKDLLPGRKSFSMSSLTRDYLPAVDTISLHRASNDVSVLKQLMEKIEVSNAMILENHKSIKQMLEGGR